MSDRPDGADQGPDRGRLGHPHGPSHDGNGHARADHGHGREGSAHAGHAHGVAAGADRRYLVVALGLLVTFMVGEVVVASLTGSLALLSDAGHMLSDVGALGASLWAMRLAARPASGAWTFGWKRAEILSAAGNGITLLVVAGIVGYEAIRRLITPPPVQGTRCWWSPSSGWSSTSSRRGCWPRPTGQA